jgi:hypothetical protein
MFETAGSCAEAFAGFQTLFLDVAILDINLGSEASIPITENFQLRKIPFMFATG